LSALPALWLIGAAATAALMLCHYRFRLAGGFLLGLCWAAAYASFQLHEALPSDLEKRDLLIEGIVSGLPQQSDEGVRFDLRVTRYEGSADVPIPGLIRLSWYRKAPVLKAGDGWQLRVRIKRPHGFLNPGGLDYEQWLFARGIRATGYVREDPLNLRIAADAGFLSPGHWRQQIHDRLDASLAWTELRGVVEALTMGEEGGITAAQWEVLRRTGTAHLVAISGSHIGLVAGIAFFLALRLCAALGARRWPPPALAAAAAAAAALAYSALADFAIPTQRALIMVGIVMGGIVWRRNLRPAHTLSVALLAVSLYDPLAVLAPGFWLSFGAVGLILLSVVGRLRPPGWWRGLWRMNWVTALGLSPLLLLFFQQISLISPIANLLAIPTMGIIAIPLCLLSTAVLLIHQEAGNLMFSGIVHFLQWVWQALDWMASLPFAQWKHAQPPIWTLGFAFSGVVLLLAPRGLPGRWLGVVLLAPAIAAQPNHPAPGDMRLTLLDVGQGLSAVVQTHRHTLVFDTGPKFSQDFDAGSAVVEPFLLQLGVKTIDMLVISHGDNDHIGGARALLDRFPIDHAYSSVPDAIPGSRGCGAGQAWVWDAVRFEMLSPFGPPSNDNDDSCVLKMSSPRGCVLLTGDIERAGEERLVGHYGDGLRCDVVVVPHHGSKTSSSETLLEKTRPRLALVSAGHLNRYGFPSSTVVARYQASGARVLNTAETGAITLNIDESKGLGVPSSYRDTHGRYWNDRPSRN
ncbi:MAG: internalization-related competence protein ComEC/Rec2, partial [Proteobacteria bacterium]|nr:internalization-related competence protein ComEC/Rec2 [Pseudomonadota bacterium]